MLSGSNNVIPGYPVLAREGVFTSSLSNPFQGIPEVHQALQTNINGSTVGAVATTNFFKLGGFKFQPISKLRVKIRSAFPKSG